MEISLQRKFFVWKLIIGDVFLLLSFSCDRKLQHGNYPHMPFLSVSTRYSFSSIVIFNILDRFYVSDGVFPYWFGDFLLQHVMAFLCWTSSVCPTFSSGESNRLVVFKETDLFWFLVRQKCFSFLSVLVN